MKCNDRTILAVSKAGHDKGRLYLVLDEDDSSCVLVNGKNRTLDRPKRKKKMHLMRITHIDDKLLEQIQNAKEDSAIAGVLEAYAKERPGAMKC